MLEALGLIEVVGLVGAIEAADTASKAADVKVIGYELTKGSGMVLVKIIGGVFITTADLLPIKALEIGTTIFVSSEVRLKSVAIP